MDELLSDDIVLIPRTDVDYRSLEENPTPEEFFLLSRVKGEVTVGQLCAAGGLGRERTTVMIDRLLRFGLLIAKNSNYQPPPATKVDPDLFGNPMSSDADDDLFGEPDDKPLFGAPPDDLFGPEGDDDLFGGGPQTPKSTAGPEEDTYVASFSNELLGGNEVEEDLFEFESPAHRSNARPVSTIAAPVIGQAPVERGRRTARAAALVSDSEVERVKAVAPIPEERAESVTVRSVQTDQNQAIKVRTKATEYRVEDRPNYEHFPEKYDTWICEDPPVIGVDAELQKEVHFVYAHLGELTYYHLFGVPMDATRKEIRGSYFSYSKRFHSDLFFGQEVGILSDRAEAVFKFASKAYDTLGKKKKRNEYDEALRAHLRASQQTDAMSSRKREVAQSTLANRARNFAQRGEFEKAASEIRRALTLAPSRDLALEGAGMLLRANVRLDEAATYARTVLRERPDDVQAMIMLGKIYEQNDLMTDALKMYERAAGFSPDDASIRVHVERIKSGTR